MTTSLTHSWTYPAPLADVRAMLLDPAFRIQVCEAQHAVTSTVDISGDLVKVEYAQATDKVPSFARKLVGESLTIVQREQWSPTNATVEITVPGKPGGATGTFTLTESDGTTTQRVMLEISAKVPLVGGKVEAMIRELLLKALAKESQAGQEWLQSH
ncbi:DUF2505 domain-containing protein [Nocardioides sp.]|jgi:hypothetical protein|uniref:DUF2505 domain-containing protein n=1 Tax=Nocardioides sp. TaxID=35761 RepID=UPI0026040877|nr:DUF2505 domain-containing protein [Nocardioides sp.]